MKIKIIAIILSLSLYCCVKKATIDLPKSEQKLVVTCFISPGDSVIGAIVRHSKPKFGGSGPMGPSSVDDIKDATVILSDGFVSATLPYTADPNNPMFSFYKTTSKLFPIYAGRTYSLLVFTPDGKKVTASTTVPTDKLNFEKFDLLIRTNDSLRIEYDLNITVADIPNRVNYIGMYSQSISENPIGYDYYDGIDHFDTDEKVSKNQFHYTFSSGFYSYDTIPVRYAEVGITALNCSKEFYLYNKSVSEGRYGSSPFSDPVMIYTNINGGFGCFGAYQATYQSKRIR